MHLKIFIILYFQKLKKNKPSSKIAILVKLSVATISTDPFLIIKNLSAISPYLKI